MRASLGGSPDDTVLACLAVTKQGLSFPSAGITTGGSGIQGQHGLHSKLKASGTDENLTSKQKS